MRPAQIEIAQLSKFFNEITIPKVVKINGAVTHTDAPAFVKHNIELLKNNEMSDPVAICRFEMLQDLKKAILEPMK